MAGPASGAPTLDEAIRRTQAFLLGRQARDGFWHFPLEANVTMDAEYLFFRRYLGLPESGRERRVADHILSTQGGDGGWSLFPGAKGHVSLTIEAYFALKLAGHRAEEEPLRRAREFIRAHGGLARASVFTRSFLASFGQFPWGGLPSMPVELVLLPTWFPVHLYALSSWARETVVPMTLLLHQQRQVRVAVEERLDELWLAPPTAETIGFPRSPDLLTWRNFFLTLDRSLKFLGRHVPWNPLRPRALRRAEEWILERQDPNGGWGGIQPPMVNAVMALHAIGYPTDHPVIARGIEAVEDFLAPAGDGLFLQPCVSPTWDTALGLKALLDSGLAPAHPALLRGADWLLDRQIFEPGDWSVNNPDLDPGGWAFEFENRWYPDVDDTAVILLQLDRIPGPEAKRRRALARGLAWAMGMQSRNGGWAAFDRDNDRAFLNEIPFADLEAMIDPPSEDLTGRLLELLGQFGFDRGSGRVRRGRDFLLGHQRPDGSWWGRWGANFIYGTWSALAGLRSIGEDPGSAPVRRAVEWLKRHQNTDGGWGESLESYADESQAGKGTSTPSQTAWALLGLLAGEDGISPALERGAKYLVDTQQEDGAWAEEEWTGTGFPRHFYLRYDGYRVYFPLMALGQFRARLSAGKTGGGRLRRPASAGQVPVLDSRPEERGGREDA